MPLTQLSSQFRTPEGPRLSDDEKVHLRQDNVIVVFDTNAFDSNQSGTLFITNKNVIWLNTNNIEDGFSVDYPHISMHAISRDDENFPRACVYCQLDDDKEESIPELRFIPHTSEAVDTIYNALCECAALNPDPIDPTDPMQNDEQGDFIFNEEEVENNLATEQNLSDNFNHIQVDDHRFADVEEDDDQQQQEEEEQQNDEEKEKQTNAQQKKQ